MAQWADDPLVINKRVFTVWDLDPKIHATQTREVVILASEDPLYYLYNCVRTKDQVDRATPIKIFPREDYIEYYVKHVWPYEPLVAFPKSRRMKVTWLCMGIMTHQWWCGYAFSGFIQSKVERDAGELVERCSFIYSQHPEWMKYPAKNITETKKPPVVRNVMAHSWIWGIPEGDDQLRQYTASLIIFDECAFQDKFRQAWASAKPTLEGGGRALIISTPNGPNFFHDLVFDQFFE
jgi:hypothetical protein